MSNALTAMALIVFLACAAQIVASLTGTPAIVPLLVAGVLVGPSVLDFVNVDDLFGDLVDPFVSLAVGVVLFDGAMQLRLRDLGGGLWRPVVRMVTFGVFLSGVIIAVSVHYLLDISLEVSILCGAILTLSGPTVVIPLLHHIRPSRRVAKVLEWEGILIDPIGAILAVGVFEAIKEGVSNDETGLVPTVVIGGVTGIVAAVVVIQLLRAKRIPMELRAITTLAIMLLAAALSDQLADDSGLITAIAVGVGVATQEELLPRVEQESFENFLAPLVSLIIGVLFVILSARVSLDAVWGLGIGAVALIAVLVFIQRPVSVGLMTLRSGLTTPERAFAAGLMPRGIVVASTASAFQFDLIEIGVPDAALLVPICFLVIAATVVIYGLAGRPYARALGVLDPEGIAVVPAATSASAIEVMEDIELAEDAGASPGEVE